jgi:CBS domain-containing protein
MSLGEICKREVVIVKPKETILQAAKLMRQHHVGNVLVVSEGDNRVPVGIVTDRDLVVEIIATELDPATITVGDIMVPGLATIKGNADVFDALQYMRAKGVRRLPVVNDDGKLVGIVTLDDILALLSEELDALAKLIAHEQRKEMNTRRC